MSFKYPRVRFAALVAAILIGAFISAGAENEESVEILLTDWLVAGPAWVPERAFSDTTNDREVQALEMPLVDYDKLLPEAGQSFDWYPGMALAWTSREVPEGHLTLSLPRARQGQLYLAYAATYIETSRWQEIALQAESTHPFALYIDGSLVAKATVPDSERVIELSAKQALHRGKHLLLIVASAVADTTPFAWGIKTSVKASEALLSSTASRRTLTYFKDIALFARASQLALSRDGNLVALVHSRRDKDFKRHSKIEIFDVQARKLIQTIEMTANLSAPFFLPSGKRLAFRVAQEEGTSIWTFDLEKAEMQQVLKPIKGLGHCIPSPDGKFLFYTMDAEKKGGTSSYSLLTELEERLTDWTDARAIYVASLENGATHSLTEVGEFAVDEFGLSCEGDKLIVTRRLSVAERPFFSTEFWLIDLSSGETSLLMAQPIAFETRPLNLAWLPGGKYVVYTAASHLTEKDETVIHNVSEVDLYLLDIEQKKTTNLSKDALFTVDEGSGLHWNPRDKHLYFVAFVRGLAKVYKVDPLGKIEFKEVSLPFSYVESMELANSGSRFAFTANSPDLPPAAYIYDFSKQQWWLLANPTAALMEIIELAKWERWNFINSDGILIDGLIYYPQNFSPEKKWPAIVYFYGGVSPQEENFYFAFHWWAANGYVVYALTPVGAIGFGQDFADKHVNDWGEFATRDVIEGTQKLIKEKPFIDAERIGAYGGSYGGFTTMDLITKTDMFAAAVSMYGISNLASYWGGGTWGYTYGDIALARSYPWNRRDVFVDKSPLFNADKIKTPLLLLHGLDDANVPALESEQMFTALKVQGKEVAYVRFPGEDHGIAGNFENYIAHREMMLEWFDKHLKGQPEAWEARWKKESGR
jgi:dipeptidyl aminopeptidase/acylaminoacyl peptidase